MDHSYVVGMRQALEKLGYSRMPDLSDENRTLIGDTAVPQDIRMDLLRDHLKAKSSRKLPPKGKYVYEGERTGRLTGGVLGGLTAGGLGAAHTSDPRRVIGVAALGALGGGYAGHRIGGGVGESTWASDTGRQAHARRVLKNYTNQRKELARKEVQHRQRLLEEQRAHDEAMRRIPQTNVNYDADDRYRPYY